MATGHLGRTGHMSTIAISGASARYPCGSYDQDRSGNVTERVVTEVSS